MGSANASLGRVSLGMAILGVVLPCGIVAVTMSMYPVGDHGRPWYILAGVVSLLCELIALVCGIAARRTASGKIGLLISGGLFVLVPLSICLGTIYALYYFRL